ncbi:MAG: Uncharacterised protein [Methanobacteriota archaeon]|nr:MAG: Uncharacterised protein [Euryarchaeota archaeon]
MSFGLLEIQIFPSSVQYKTSFVSEEDLLANSVIKSHPVTPSLSVCLRNLGAFRHNPSPITNNTPPLTLESSILRTFAYPAHSTLSVDSPLIITGQARTILSISSGVGLYCNPTRYNPNSSLTRSTSGVVGT